jgi:hypothetical protein
MAAPARAHPAAKTGASSKKIYRTILRINFRFYIIKTYWVEERLSEFKLSAPGGSNRDFEIHAFWGIVTPRTGAGDLRANLMTPTKEMT